MVTKRTKAVIAVVLVLAALAAAFRYVVSDERAVRKELASLGETLSKSGPEAVLAAALTARKAAGFFEDPCRLSIQSPDYEGTISRKELMDRIVLTRSRYEEAEVDFAGITVTFPGRELAQVLCVVRLRGRTGGAENRDLRQMEAVLQKTGGAWLFAEIRVRAPER